ncbi:anthranilate phosphoribosyltransferase, partial [Kitasatospora sp. NPDC059803]|uniref:anthranilate phosphoribosyltransferase n=1 Tax=Kitasatospora sp. NPDC059803 TaxID=3346953 RepID=UPI00364691F6
MTGNGESRSWPQLLAALIGGTDLSTADTAWAMDRVMRGEAAPAQLAGFLVALRAKGETAEEVDGLVRAAREHTVRVDVPGPTLDIVGTGGDGAKTVNVSTMAAIVAAAAGARVVKHGNRSASSASGSADVLERLGIALELSAEEVARSVREIGIGFCFAPAFHPAFRHAAVARKELGVPTAFNALGPLTNPASPTAMAVGVADPRLGPLIAAVFARQGVDALVFRGDDGLDELSVSTTSTVWTATTGRVVQERLDPRELGIATAAPDALRGGDAAHNAGVVHPRQDGGQ